MKWHPTDFGKCCQQTLAKSFIRLAASLLLRRDHWLTANCYSLYKFERRMKYHGTRKASITLLHRKISLRQGSNIALQKRKRRLALKTNLLFFGCKWV